MRNSEGFWHSHRRPLVLGIAVAVVATAAGFLFLKQPPRPLAREQALAEFRARMNESQQAVTPSGAGEAPSRGDASVPPDPSAASAPTTSTTVVPSSGPPAAGASRRAIDGPVGVFVYATEGYEKIDALGGDTHAYPAETYFSIAPTDCGRVLRWQPFDDRWDELRVCVGADTVELERFSTSHAFFRRRLQQAYSCDPRGLVLSRTARPGERWQWSCGGPDGRMDTTVEVLADETMTVDGKERTVTRQRFRTVLQGTVRGEQVQERWTDLETAMLLKGTTVTDTEGDGPVGPIHYQERLTLTLKSLEPAT